MEGPQVNIFTMARLPDVESSEIDPEWGVKTSTLLLIVLYRRSIFLLRRADRRTGCLPDDFAVVSRIYRACPGESKRCFLYLLYMRRSVSAFLLSVGSRFKRRPHLFGTICEPTPYSRPCPFELPPEEAGCREEARLFLPAWPRNSNISGGSDGLNCPRYYRRGGG